MGVDAAMVVCADGDEIPGLMAAALRAEMLPVVELQAIIAGDPTHLTLGVVTFQHCGPGSPRNVSFDFLVAQFTTRAHPVLGAYAEWVASSAAGRRPRSAHRTGCIDTARRPAE